MLFLYLFHNGFRDSQSAHACKPNQVKESGAVELAASAVKRSHSHVTIQQNYSQVIQSSEQAQSLFWITKIVKATTLDYIPSYYKKNN